MSRHDKRYRSEETAPTARSCKLWTASCKLHPIWCWSYFTTAPAHALQLALALMVQLWLDGVTPGSARCSEVVVRGFEGGDLQEGYNLYRGVAFGLNPGIEGRTMSALFTNTSIVKWPLSEKIPRPWGEIFWLSLTISSMCGAGRWSKINVYLPVQICAQA